MKKLIIYALVFFLAAGMLFLGGCGGSSDGDGGTATNYYTIYGTVVDSQNTTISGMNCTLTSSTEAIQSATSDSNGSFSFSNVTEGTYNVLCDQGDYIPSRYYITVTANGETYKGVTSLKMVVLTPEEYDSFAGYSHYYDSSLGYIMPVVLDKSDQEMEGVSFSSQPGALAIGYIDQGIDWDAVSTFAYQGRGILEVTPGPSYTIYASMSGSDFSPSSITITPQQGELTLIQFKKE
jgi:hypothetical protein